MLKKLRYHRQRLPKEKAQDEDRFEYARALALVNAASRDAFFESLETLVDRQSSDLVRVKALQLFVEFGAIETASQGEPPFGQMALVSLGNIMRSSPELHTLFIFECLKEPFTHIIMSMSETYLGTIARELSIWTRQKQHQFELADGLGVCAKKFAKVHQVLLDRVERFWEQPSENPEEWRGHRDNNAFNAICQIITFTCKSPTAARRYLPELPIRLYTKMDDFARLRGVYIKNGWIFSPFLMMSELASACRGVADFFAGPTWDKKVIEPELVRFYEPLTPALINHQMVPLLLAQLSQLLWEERESFGEPTAMAYYAQTLFSIIKHSVSAADKFLEDYKKKKERIIASQSRNGTLSFFAVQVLKRALEFAQTCGPLCNACVQSVVMICFPESKTHEAKWAGLREEMDNNLPEIVHMLQDICQKLLTTTADQQSEASKDALIGVITIMSKYSSAARGALFNTEMVKNYSREQIIFRVLSTETGTSSSSNFVDDSVRLAAAKCLVALDVSNFQQQGIQQLLELFSSIPTVVSPTHYQVLCYLTYFLFKMALHDDTTEGRSSDNSPGKVFRTLYAPEISATIFSILERLIIESSGEHSSYWELRFMQACVKFLMSGWVKMEFHADNLGPRPIDILSAITTKEQLRIVQLAGVFEERKNRYYRLIEQRRCVVSEDDLEDLTEQNNKNYKLPEICLKKYAHVKLSRLDYQHAFLEQTSLGARASNLLPSLNQLRRVDIVAFRLIHQLANVIENVTFVGSVHALLEASFAEWNKVDPGKPVAQCDTDEQPTFGERSAAVTAQGNSELVDVRVCSNTDNENRRLYNLYALYRNVRLPQPLPEEIKAGVIMPGVVLSELAGDDRNVSLVARMGREIVAAVFAGPFLKPLQQEEYRRRRREAAIAAGRNPRDIDPNDPTDLCNCALVTGYFHDPELKAELRLLQGELLAVLSHQLSIRGFRRCYVRADKVEQQMLSASGAHSAPTGDEAASSAAGGANGSRKSREERKDAGETGDAAAMGVSDGAREIFYWNLSHNIWRKNKEHIFFIKNKMLEQLLQLLLDDQNHNRVEDAKRAGKIPSVKAVVQRFTPTIRIKMEEYGGQLTNEFEGTNADGSHLAFKDDHLGDMDAEDDAAPGVGRRRADGAAERKRFRNIVEREFKNGLVTAQFRLETPVWEKVLAGSREETLVEAMTRVSSSMSTAPQPMVAAALLSQLPPDLNPRTNPDSWPNEWLSRDMERTALDNIEGGSSTSGPGGKKALTPEGRQQQREIEAEMRRRRETQLEQEHNRIMDEREAEKRRREWDLPPLLQSWVVPSSAAVLRMMYSLLTKSQADVFQQVCTSLRTVPAQGLGLLEAIRATLSTFQYQLRASVLDSLPGANYNVCMKVLLVIEHSLVDVSAGLEPALASLEYYELCLEIVKDMARLLTALLESRSGAYTAAATQGAATVPKARISAIAEGEETIADARSAAAAAAAAAANGETGSGPASAPTLMAESAAFSVVGKGTLDPTEERLMYGICKTLVALMSQVARICLFKGTSFLINEGNRKCRLHAQQQLFTKSELLCDTILAILLYDLEKENETEDVFATAAALVGNSASGDGKDKRVRTNHVVRDKMRVYAIQVLAYFIHVDQSFRYSFLNEYAVSSIKAERSLRSSLVQQVLEAADLLKFKDRLESFLRVQRLIGQDEFIVHAHFFEHSIGAPQAESFSGAKLVFITNKAFFISSSSYAEDMAQNIKDFTGAKQLAQFVHLDRYEFTDIVRLYRDISGQVLAIRRFVDPPAARLRSPVIRKQTEILLQRTQGVVDMFLTELSRRARDDAHRVHTVALDEVTPAALPFLFRECSRDKTVMSSAAYPKLMTHVHVIKRDKSVVKRAMFWVTVGEGGEQFIVITPFDAKSWEPSLAGEDDDEIYDAGAWDPAKVARPPLSRQGGSARGGVDAATITAKSDQLKAMFSVPPPSALPEFMNALPSLPVGNFGGAVPFYFPVSEIQSVDFTEDSEAEMIIRIRRTDPSRIPSVYIKFADDTGREMWRRELKKLFYSGSFGRWQENILPDLSDASRRKQELL